jgi:hypothetical protein
LMSTKSMIGFWLSLSWKKNGGEPLSKETHREMCERVALKDCSKCLVSV